MEEKLLELKEQFCNWYCPNKEEDLIFCSGWTECKECNEIIECDKDLPHIDFCSECQIGKYIKFIRDELGEK